MLTKSKKSIGLHSTSSTNLCLREEPTGNHPRTYLSGDPVETNLQLEFRMISSGSLLAEKQAVRGVSKGNLVPGSNAPLLDADKSL